MSSHTFLSLQIQPVTSASIWWNISQLVAIAAIGIIASWVCLVFYRLYLHPLRNVPGPKVAAATSWYEFYQDVVLDGHYIKEYPRLHAKYGTIALLHPRFSIH